MIRKELKARWKNWSSAQRWAASYLLVWISVAIFANFLANDRPLLASYQGTIHWPVFRQIGEKTWGLPPFTDLPGRRWANADVSWAIWPPIPYAPSTLDIANSNYASPLGAQKVKSVGWRHHLGTDQLGRDTLAGLIWGSRTALLVGIIAMSLALLIGLFFGSLGGYFGNNTLRKSRWVWWGTLSGILFCLLYCFGSLWPFLHGKPFLLSLVASLVCCSLFVLISQQLLRLLSRFWHWWAQAQYLALDHLVLRIIEIFNAVPTLVLLIVVLGMLQQANIFSVMLIIGLVRWTGIARFVRGELLKIRELPYIQAAQLSGLSHFRILVRHALPNALAPVLVAFAFGMAGAILLEAFLSFLGLGLSADQVSWGSLLQQSRNKAAAWWLAIFPGLAIFFTVLSLNLLADRR